MTESLVESISGKKKNIKGRHSRMILVSSQGSQVCKFDQNQDKGWVATENEVGREDDFNLLFKDAKDLGEVLANCGRKWGATEDF